MIKKNNMKFKWIWLCVILLFTSVAATAVVFFSRLDPFLLDDDGAISLITDDNTDVNEDVDVDDTDVDTNNSTPGNSIENNKDSENNNQEDNKVSTPTYKPGFEASDDKVVWKTNTQVEIFRVSYENGEQVVTVNSDNKDKVIAPGTENSYTFKLKNTGNVALDYTVEVDAYFTPADVVIPVTGRINRYDGKWLAGDNDNFAEVSVLNNAADNATLGAGNYTYYTLDWVWPFERGDDEYDTFLGNLATEQDLEFTIVIKTTATANVDADDDGGITPPTTGDIFNVSFWLFIAAASLILMIILFIIQRKNNNSNDEEVECP